MPLRPSISTRQSRQEPNASRLSVAQSFGIGACSSAAAAITDVPLGTLTCAAVDGQRHLLVARRGSACRCRVRCGKPCGASYSAAATRGGAVRNLRGNGRARSAPGSGVRPPSAHSEPSSIVSQRSRSSAILASRRVAGDDLVDQSRRRASSRCGTACICRSSRPRRTAWRSAPAAPCRRCRRTRRCRRGRACPWPPPSPRSRAACRAALRGNRRRAGRRPAPRGSAGRSACRRRNPRPGARIVAPNASSTRPPRLMLPASWNGCEPRERPTP